MSRESLVLLLGIVLFFVPSLGVPNDWKEYVVTGIGFLLILLGYFLRRAAYLRNIETSDGVRSTNSFVESTKKIPFKEEVTTK